MTPVRVERAHLAPIAALERNAFVHPWSEKALEILCEEGGVGFVCMHNGKAIAYAGMQIVLDEGAITNVATHTDYRSRGLGRTVLAALLEAARQTGVQTVTLEVRPSNAPAIALYERLGFVVVGRRKHFYTAPVEDALVMLCTLGEACGD